MIMRIFSFSLLYDFHYQHNHLVMCYFSSFLLLLRQTKSKDLGLLVFLKELLIRCKRLADIGTEMRKKPMIIFRAGLLGWVWAFQLNGENLAVPVSFFLSQHILISNTAKVNHFIKTRLHELKKKIKTTAKARSSLLTTVNKVYRVFSPRPIYSVNHACKLSKAVNQWSPQALEIRAPLQQLPLSRSFSSLLINTFLPLPCNK